MLTKTLKKVQLKAKSSTKSSFDEQGGIYPASMVEDRRNLVDDYKGLAVADIKQDMSLRSHDFHVAIENLQHDLNIGSIVRSANAFNAQAVHIIGKKHWNRRGAMATEKYLDVFYYPAVDDFVMAVKSSGLTIIGVDNIDGAVPLAQVSLPRRVVLVFGQEGPGLSEAMVSRCESVVAIEQFGSTRSLNVSAAAAIAMYSWLQRYVV